MSATDELDSRRSAMRAASLADEAKLARALASAAQLSSADRSRISATAADLVRQVRLTARPTPMEGFLGEYGLATPEGGALMSLAEALLRVPDPETADALIADKIGSADWRAHVGRAASPLVNGATRALALAGWLLADGGEADGVLRRAMRRVGRPAIRHATRRAIRELGRQFVLGGAIGEAMKRARRLEAVGYAYSYDMLGEAARTEVDARRYFEAYADAIAALAARCVGDVRSNPGVSVKLSALHPRYEFGQRDRVLTELAARTRDLARLARRAGMGFNVDAEEADRLDLSLDVIEAVLSDPELAGWDGFGVVVQAYGKRAAHVLDWLYALAERLDRRIMVRLVKGAYWDAEIKRAQTLGLDGFPVFTRKASTDVSYIACARKLLGMTDRIYPQFATHNAHTIAAVLHMATDSNAFEFQRLHGMGEALHDLVLRERGTRCRIYAPVGAHRDLLAYLVRRLLENGANSSFVNQIADASVPPEAIARDPFDAVAALGDALPNRAIAHPAALFEPSRRNSQGWDLTDPAQVAAVEAARAPFRAAHWRAAPTIAADAMSPGPTRAVRNPADPSDVVGTVEEATTAHVEAAFAAATAGFAAWAAEPVEARASRLERVADLYEAHAAEFFALAAREAGKTLADGVAEVREAVDFLRYYAAEARRLEAAEPGRPRGVFVCVSPWNFPLAIFTGQIAAALAAGDVAIAKPAEQTPLIAARAVALMHAAGIPRSAVQLLPGDGETVGAALTRDPRVDGICFTGSTETAQAIHRALAANGPSDAPLIAETGGLNAMIVDATALPEQAVRDIVASAFQSAGQRCSALRVLYVQEDVADKLLPMLFGAMDELRIGAPWDLSADVGPVIDAAARDDIVAYCARMEREGRLLKKLKAPDGGNFVAPAVFKVSGIADVAREVFGPVLHVATFAAGEFDAVVDAVNARGYGLTCGLHTRIEGRAARVAERVRVGNLYVNRNQIGAVVGSQPFGGEGLSGTGPKAGGPHYLRRFRRASREARDVRTAPAPNVGAAAVQGALRGLGATGWRDRADRMATLRNFVAASPAAGDWTRRAFAAVAAIDAAPRDLPGPTGESNRLRLASRGVALCLGPSPDMALAQAVQALALGGGAVVVAQGAEAACAPLVAGGAPLVAVEGVLDPAALVSVEGFAAVAYAGDALRLRALRMALAKRPGALVPMIPEIVDPHAFAVERHVCVDTTAAGGNASLLASQDAESAFGSEDSARQGRLTAARA